VELAPGQITKIAIFETAVQKGNSPNRRQLATVAD
jgi:hypothetical protein